ncbi:MAG: LPS export ABC transporter permease LptF [Pseudomonadota bacterium]
MTRFDRYMLSQFMVLFGFFALILVSIFWINKAVRQFDRLIGDGQPAWVILEFTALTLPGVIGMVLPIAAFAAAVYVTNRLSTESELTVVQATGYSPWRLVRPAFVFGVIIAVIMSLLSHYLIPTSLGELRQREAEVRQSISARFLEEGEFLHPAPGITFYIGEITPEGELRDVFLSDRRDLQNSVEYSSIQAYLVQDGTGTSLVMVSGLAQTLRGEDGRLFTTHFDDFSYDISSLISQNPATLNRVEFAHTGDLILRPAAVMDRTGASEGALQFTLHSRFAQAFMCIVAALVGFSTLLLGGFSRFGVWWQITTAFVLLVVIKVVEGSMTGVVIANAGLWPVMYAPAALGFGLTAVLLYLAGRPALFGRLKRVVTFKRSDPDAAGDAA